MGAAPHPTDRELAILKVLWQRGPSTVREVYEALAVALPIVQNTVQAFLRTMEEKGMVRHALAGRTFVYEPVLEWDQTRRRLVSRLLHRVFDGAIDQLVDSALAVRPPTPDELARLEALLEGARSAASTRGARSDRTTRRRP